MGNTLVLWVNIAPDAAREIVVDRLFPITSSGQGPEDVFQVIACCREQIPPEYRLRKAGVEDEAVEHVAIDDAGLEKPHPHLAFSINVADPVLHLASHESLQDELIAGIQGCVRDGDGRRQPGPNQMLAHARGIAEPQESWSRNVVYLW